MSDDQFNAINKQFDTLTASLTALAKRMDDGFANCATTDQLDAVYDLLDKNMRDHERQEQERAGIALQLDRHEAAIRELQQHNGLAA